MQTGVVASLSVIVYNLQASSVVKASQLFTPDSDCPEQLAKHFADLYQEASVLRVEWSVLVATLESKAVASHSTSV